MIPRYHYISKKEAIKGKSMIFLTSDTKIPNFVDYFEDKISNSDIRGNDVIEFFGTNLPYYVTFEEETGTIREATREERYNRTIEIEGVIYRDYDLEENEYYDPTTKTIMIKEVQHDINLEKI